MQDREYNVCGMSKLTEWLKQQLDSRGWTYNELGRRAELSSGTISNVMGDRTNPGLDFCIGVARAFGERPEMVLRLAGLLPPIPDAVDEESEILSIVRHLPPAKREAALDMLRGLAKRPIPVTSPEAAGSVPAQTAEDDTGDQASQKTEQMFYGDFWSQADHVLVEADRAGMLEQVAARIQEMRQQQDLQGTYDTRQTDHLSGGDG